MLPAPAIDEMVDGAGLRPHWRPLLGALSALGEGGLAGRAARLDRAAATRLSRAGSMRPRESAELQILARCLAESRVIAEAAAGPVSFALRAALLASTAPGGAVDELMRLIAGLTESVRDRLTDDMYATFTQSLRSARCDAAGLHDLHALAHAMVGILRFSTAVAGAAAENRVGGGGWLFLELGRRIERAHAVAAEIAFALDQPPPRFEIGLRLALELCDSATTYRSRWLNVLQPAPVLDLVLADQGNPRGLAFQFVAMHTLLDELSDRITPSYFALLPAARTLGMQGLVVGGEAGRLRGAA
ncbi:MAG TPA: alpha-E domain-containing protein [Acetobacteraceae bacterium]|nr:alpha-E domain-containing protein [Acetobacteraceae bacterium]